MFREETKSQLLPSALPWDLFGCLSSVSLCREVLGQAAASIPWIAEMWFQGYLTLANSDRDVREFPGP